MASEVIDAGAGSAIKLRKPWVVATFTVISLGVYWLFWYYKVNREMRNFGASRQDPQLAGSKPWESVLAVTLGGLVVIPALVSLLRSVERAAVTEQLATGSHRRTRGLRVVAVAATLLPRGIYVQGAGLLIALCGFVALVVFVSLLQARLNTAWRASALADRDFDRLQDPNTHQPQPPATPAAERAVIARRDHAPQHGWDVAGDPGSRLLLDAHHAEASN